MSGLNIDQILYDPSDNAQGPRIGAHLLDPSGINFTGGQLVDDISSSGIQALDTRAFLTGYDAVGGNWDRVHIDPSGSLNVAVQAFTAVVKVEGTVADDAADANNPVKVGSKSLSGVLAAVSASGDRADLISDTYRRVRTNSAPNIAINSEAVTVGTSAVQLDTTPLAGRISVTIQNNGTKNIFVGPSGVTTSSGLKIAANASLTRDIGEDIPLYAISGTAGQSVVLFSLA